MVASAVRVRIVHQIPFHGGQKSLASTKTDPHRQMNDSNLTQSPSGNSPIALVRKAFLYANTITGTVEIVLCVIVLIASIRIKAHHSPRNLLVFVSAAVDLIRGVHSVFSPFLYDAPVSNTPLNLIACQSYQWVHAFQYAASCWIVAAIAYSRYDYVALPMRPKLTMPKTIIILCFIFAEAGIFASLPLIGWQRYYLRKLGGNGSYRCSSADGSLDVGQRAFTPVYFGLNAGLPLIVIAVCLGGIVPIAVKSTRWQQKTMKKRNSTSRVVPRDEDRVDVKEILHSKAFQYIVLIVLSNVILSAPFVICRSIRDFSRVKLNDYVIPVTKLIFNTNFIVNSVLYVFWVRTFRDNIASLVCCKRKMKRATSTYSSKASTLTYLEASNIVVSTEESDIL